MRMLGEIVLCAAVAVIVVMILYWFDNRGGRGRLT